MKIQKGIVKYKDRNDIVCTYGVTDDGKQFYFLDETDEKKFANGNRIASTELVEAIDPMVKASHIGVVGADGNEVIPFVNKSIRPVNDSIILVEVAKPTSPSVLEAISLKSDPLSAAKLVSTPAAIKEKLNAKMGAEGRYLFNDQFSEVTVCDIDGNNLVKNELYSFAGVSNGKLYLSKNTVDSEIFEFSVLPPEVQTNDEKKIAVTDVNVSKDVVDDALNDSSSSMVSDIPPIVSEESAEVDENTDKDVKEDVLPVAEDISDEVESVKDDIIPVVENNTEEKTESAPVVDDNTEEKIESAPVIDNNTEEKIESVPVVDNNTEEKIESVPVVLDKEKTDSIEKIVDSVVPVEDSINEVSPAKNNESVINNIPITDISDDKSNDDETTLAIDEDTSDLSDDVDDFTTTEDEDEEDVAISFTEPTTASLPSVEDSLLDDNSDFSIPDLNFGDTKTDDENSNSTSNASTSDLDMLNDDLFNEKTYGVEKVDTDDYYNDSYSQTYDDSTSSIGRDSIMSDVAKSLTSLMKQNRNQKSIISEYKDKIDKLSASRRNIAEKAKIQEQKLEALNNKNRNFETTISKLEAKLQMLEGRIRDQDKLIAYQSKELDSIKPQKDDLAKLVADAQALLGDDSSNSYPF